MFKPTILNILLYLFLKYIAFYIFLMFKHDDFRLLQIESINDLGNSLYYFSVMMLPLILIIMALFSVPIYFAFRLKNAIYFSLIVVAFLIAEYIIYTYSASQTNLMNGLYNGILSTLFLLLFFFRNIKLLFMTDAKR
jgi:hypothetical protein